jgi:hypothetical protein
VAQQYRHRKSRFAHQLRYGWNHYTQHRDGIRHRHSRNQSFDRSEVQRSAWRTVPRRMWPREIGKQVIFGIGLGLFTLLVVAALFTLIAFLNARHDISEAQKLAKEIVNHRTELLSSQGRVVAGGQLDKMRDYAIQADNALNDNVAVSILKIVPIIGSQVSGLTSAVHDVDLVAQNGQSLLLSAEQSIAASHGTSINLPSVAALDKQVKKSDKLLTSLIRPAGGLWGPAHSERVKLNTELTKIVALLHRGSEALDFAQPFLGANGPHVYFVAGENNSEMRDQGAVLSWALLHVNNGTFSMERAASVGNIDMRNPAAAITDPGTREAFGALQPTRVWQSVNAVGNFPQAAKWIMAMFNQRMHIKVDGVVGVDVQTLADILKVTGGVKVKTIPGKTVDASNVASMLLYRLYLQYPAGSQQGRHDEITAVAQASVNKMKRGNYDLGEFIHELARASQGRHLLFYDADPRLESTVVSFGGGGGMEDLGPNAIHLAIEAGEAAKVDWFMHSDVTYDVRVDTHGTAYITTTLLLHNSAPINARPSYALGPDHTESFKAGEYVGRIFLWLPKGATSGAETITEENMSLERAIRRVYAGETQFVRFSDIWLGAVKHGSLTLNFIPQSLIHPSKVTVNFSSSQNFDGPDQSTFDGGRFITLHWSANR